jgi:hypothetical protein
MDEGLLKVGDLVRPHVESFQDYYDRYYKYPGILTEVLKVHTGGGHYRMSYKIYWSDGRTTTEHAAYIKKVE